MVQIDNQTAKDVLRHWPHPRLKQKRVFICSPYRGNETLNTYNARFYCWLAIKQNLIPIAPHLYFTQFFTEDNEHERNAGISMGLELMHDCEEVWAFYSAFDGPSEGMKTEMDYAESIGIPVKHIDPSEALQGESYPLYVHEPDREAPGYEPANLDALWEAQLTGGQK